MASIHTHIPSAHSSTSAPERRGEVSDSDPLSEMNFCFVLRNEKRIQHNSALCFIDDLEKVKLFFSPLHLVANFKALVCVFDRECIKLWVALDESDHHSCESNTKRQIEGERAGKEEVCFCIRDTQRVYLCDSLCWSKLVWCWCSHVIHQQKICLLIHLSDRALKTLGIALLLDETGLPYEARRFR